MEKKSELIQMDQAVGGAVKEAAAASACTNFYPSDLVSYRSVHGLAKAHSWAFPPTDEFVIACADGAQITKKAGDVEVTLLDRSYLHAGQTVVSASDDSGQIGIVTDVTTFVDLIELNDSDEARKVVATGVPPSALRRVRALSLGDYVVSGPWLGRVVEVSLDVYVVFDDGAMCRVTNAGSKEHPWVKRPRCYRPQENPSFYPGMRVVSTAFSAFFRGARWLKGHMMKREGEEGTVVRVEMAGVLVRWIASAHLGTDQQLVEESAPPAYQNPDNLTFFCSDSCCFWAVGDHCFLWEESSLTASDTSGTHGLGDAGSDHHHHHQDEQPRTCLPQSDGSSSASGDEHDEPSSPSPTRIPPAAPPALITKKERSTEWRQHRKMGGQREQRHDTRSAPMTVSNTHTTVDVLWQDGTRQHGAPSTSLNRLVIMNEDELFPGQYVVDATGDDAMDMGAAAAKASTRRTGVVKSVNSKDHTANVSWFPVASGLEEANSYKEPECDDTVSAYDLGRDPDHSIFYGDIVIRLLSNVSGSTTVEQPHEKCNKKQRAPPTDLSWVGHVVDLHHGHVQVKWGDGSMSTVLPHEISIANKEYYEDLQDEMGEWVEEDNVDAPEEFDTTTTVLPHEITVANKEHYEDLQDEMGDWVEEDSVDAPEKFDTTSTDNDPDDDPVDATTVEGASVEGGNGSVNELDGSTTTRTVRLGGVIQFMIRAFAQVLARGKRYLVNWSLPSQSDLQKTTHDVDQVPAHVYTGTQQDPGTVGDVTEASALGTRSDGCIDEDDPAEDMKKARNVNGGGDPSNFLHFDVLQSPPDHHYIDNMDQGSSGGKVWVKAVQKEWKILENNLPDTIYVRAYEDRMDLLRAAMVGASRTPYQDGLFFFDLHLPPSYPAMPPQVYYHSFGLRLNPNLDESGTVCLSLLDTFGGEGTELWSPGTSSLLQVVVSIQALVLNDQPFYNEDGYEELVDKPEGHRNALTYNENAFLLTLRTALHLLRRAPHGFERFVQDHFRRRGRYVLGMCKAYLRGCMPTEEGGMELPCSAGFRITLANMVTRLVAAFEEIGTEGCDRGPLDHLKDANTVLA